MKLFIACNAAVIVEDCCFKAIPTETIDISGFLSYCLKSLEQQEGYHIKQVTALESIPI